MIQYTCDGCGVRLKDDTERYVVIIEVRRGDQAPRDYGFDDYVDPEEEREPWKEGAASENGQDGGGTRVAWRFDLCTRCYALYTEDPMAIVSLKRGRSRS